MDKLFSLPSDLIPPKTDLSRTNVLVVGDVMLDRYWFGRVDRISPEAPVPVVHVVRSEDRLGGAANVARNVVMLGAQATLVGIVGQDDAGLQVRQYLTEAGVNDALFVDDGIPTTVKMRVLGSQQQLIRIDFEEQPASEVVHLLNQQVKHLIDAHDVIVFSDYAKGVLDQVSELISYAKNKQKCVLVDPKGDQFERYRGANIISPNRKELMQVVGPWKNESDLAERSQQLRHRFDFDGLLVTRSEEGMSLFSDSGADHIPALAREVFDVSGAGDTVLATFAVMTGAGLSFDQAMRWANLAGGVVVAKLGTSTVSYDELLHAFHTIKD